MADQVERGEKSGGIPLIRQKIGAGLRTDDAVANALTQAVARSLAQSAFGLWGLLVSPTKHGASCCNIGDMADRLSSSDLLIVLERTDGARAALAFDPVFVSSVIQKQTLGTVTSQSVPDRQFTSTDASLLRPVCEGVVHQAAERVADQGLEHLLKGFEFGARVTDVRSLLLLLNDGEYFVLQSEFEIDSDRRVGRITCILPNALANEKDEAAEEEPLPTLQALSETMRAQLTAVLARTVMSSEAILALSPGDELSVSINLDAVEIVSITGEVAAHGRLGRISGKRAVRVQDNAQKVPSIHAPGIEFVDKPSFTQEIGGAEQRKHADIATTKSDELNDNDGTHIAAMTPDEAAAEITQLAGLIDEPVSA